MNLHSGKLFWPSTVIPTTHENPPIQSFYDVIIVGAGMSGMLTAHALINEGLKVAIVDRRKIAAGSTAANTGLLQFSNDMTLHELAEQIGEDNAVRFYRLCYEAVNELEQIAQTLPEQADFIRRPSIYFASHKKHIKKLQKEYDMLQHYGFPAQFWDEETLKQKVPYNAPAALVTQNDAEVNPYKFVLYLAQQLQTKGLDIFENTYVNLIEDNDFSIELHTINGIFKTKHIVYTTGYDQLPFGKIDNAAIHRSYAIVTQPLHPFPHWYEDALMWETARPYIYMRKTVDQRIIIGGLDESKAKPVKKEQKIEKMAQKLLERLQELIPNVTFEAPFQYCATFGESKDNLPFIGAHPTKRNHLYLLGYGGNGTVYSKLGAKILADLICDRPNVDEKIVSIQRAFKKDGL